jgi:hydroxyacylglutathione hydrolase
MGATAGSGVEVVAIDTPTLGDRSYLAHDGEVAVVVDPQRDIDRVLALAAARGVRITHVFETHLHNDYVTGGLSLALATGAGPLPRACPLTASWRTRRRSNPGASARAHHADRGGAADELRVRSSIHVVLFAK